MHPLRIIHFVLAVLFTVTSIVQYCSPLYYKAVIGLTRNSVLINHTVATTPDTYFYKNTYTQVDLSSLGGTFLLFAAIDHGVQGVFNKWSTGPNLPRWTEYSITASLMNVMIAVAVGIDDYIKMAGICYLTVCMMYQGYLVEAKKARDARGNVIHNLFVGWLCFVSYWAVILI